MTGSGSPVPADAARRGCADPRARPDIRRVVRRPRRTAVATIIAIGYPSEATAALAADEIRALSADLLIEADAIAEVVRDKEGAFRVTTNHDVVAAGSTYGMFWSLLFGVLFFVPVLGMTVGTGLRALMDGIEKHDVDPGFQQKVRDMLLPGTSALFLVVESASADRAVAGLVRFRGTALMSPLSGEAHDELQVTLRGA